ncbi:ZIP family zinc transporter [Saxibacter everestensis]|uniref:ZIP family zinc transporter n=1 Tax=Saxibacter everestensis TaxID=2909229 RepID=A0ABY8QTQ0_9MICO|nr:ZIP family zinc transporter [Brevibacteriaceae bacterium ZFBP1038]
MSQALLAGLWGLVGGAALLIGSAIAWWFKVPTKVTAAVMAFGAGVLISALTFELVEKAEEQGGLLATLGGALFGAFAYLGANMVLARHGARHRKRSGSQQPSEADQQGSGTAIAVGALLDGVPESIVLGLGLVGGAAVSPAMLVAVFISNVPEGLSSTSGMKRSGRRAGYVFGVWGAIAVVSGLASLIGYLALQSAPGEVIAFITATAAGAILTMVADTMVPEAFDEAGQYSGIITTVGFLAAFSVHVVGG